MLENLDHKHQVHDWQINIFENYFIYNEKYWPQKLTFTNKIYVYIVYNRFFSNKQTD